MITRRAVVAALAAGLTCIARAEEKLKLVVTGDLGTIGGRLYPLLAPQYDVIGIDKRRGAHQDLAFPGRWEELLSGAAAIVHLAWDIQRYNDPAGIMYNAWITANALSAAHRAGVKRFIFASSAWAAPGLYGKKTGKEPALYTESKLFAEAMLTAFTAATGMSTSAIRFGQVHTVGSKVRPTAAEFDDRIVMADEDLRGLINLAMRTNGYSMFGPFDAR